MNLTVLIRQSYNERLKPRLDILGQDVTDEGWTSQFVSVPDNEPFDATRQRIFAMKQDALYPIAIRLPYAGTGGYDGHREEDVPWPTSVPWQCAGDWGYLPGGNPGMGWGPYYQLPYAPSAPSWSVGSLNFNNMGLDEPACIEGYLDKVHNVRTGKITFANNAAMQNGFAGRYDFTGLKADFAALVGSRRFDDFTGCTEGRLFELMRGFEYGIALISGGGREDALGTIQAGTWQQFLQFAAKIYQAVSFGSWFGNLGRGGWMPGSLLNPFCCGNVWGGADPPSYLPTLTEGVPFAECVRRKLIDEPWYLYLSHQGDPTLRRLKSMDATVIADVNDLKGRMSVAENKLTAMSVNPIVKPIDTPPPVTPTFLRKINVGGPSVADFEADIFPIDALRTFFSSNSIDVSGLADFFVPAEVFQSCRFDLQAGIFAYSLTSAKWKSGDSVGVWLLWADPGAAEGERALKITVNGAVVESALDIMATARTPVQSGLRKAVQKQYRTTVGADGKITIEIAGTKGFLCGICISK